MGLQKIEPSVHLGRDVQVSADHVQVGRNVSIGDRAQIEVKRLALADNVSIAEDVTIRAETLDLGLGTRIGQRCQIAGMGEVPELIRIGEQTLIGHDSKLLVPIAVIGDYTTIHHHALISGRKPVVMGHNVWIGQNCVINSEDRLTIGNHVGVGAYSSIYTHGYFGDLLEGCQVFKVAPVMIEDDAWILGGYNVVSPGVTIGAKALVLTGSNVTRSVPANHAVAGSPAKDVTDKLVPYRDVSVKEKYEKIAQFLQEYVEDRYSGVYDRTEDGFVVRADFGTFRIIRLPEVTQDTALPGDRPLLVFTQASRVDAPPDGVTIFDLGRRQYTRTRSEAEIRTIAYLKSYRARFVPSDQPRVVLPEICERP